MKDAVRIDEIQVTWPDGSGGSLPPSYAEINSFVVMTRYGGPRGDADRDGDLDDFAVFDSCFTGPQAGLGRLPCAAMDMDHDGDIDLLNFRLFQQGLTGESQATLPGLVGVASANSHDVVGQISIPVDIAATVEANSGMVTTESRLDGIRRLQVDFATPLDASVGSLGPDALDITPATTSVISTTLHNDDMRLLIDLNPPLDNQQTYTFTLTDAVVAAGAATPGDRDFQLRAVAGNVTSESGAGPQVVNALDIGINGIRGNIGADVSNPAYAGFDVNQDGVINVMDASCVRLVCGVWTNTAP